MPPPEGLWVRDPKTEDFLRRQGVKEISYERVPWANIDREEGLRHQGRLSGAGGRLNQDQVVEIAVFVTPPPQGQGGVLPAVVLQRPPKGAPLWPLAGNHRLGGVELAFPDVAWVEAYVVSIRDPQLLDLLPRRENAKESGLGFSREDRLANALYEHHHHGIPVAQAAATYGLKPSDLYNANVVGRTKEMLKDVEGAAQFSEMLLRALHAGFSQQLDLMRAVAQLIVRHGLRGTDALLVVRNVGNARTANQKALALKAEEEKFALRRGGGRKKSEPRTGTSSIVREQVLRHALGLSSLLERYTTFQQLQLLDPADQVTLLQACEKIDERVKALQALAAGAAAPAANGR